MQRLKTTGIITLAALFVFSTSVAWAASDDDDEDDAPAPVAKMHIKAKPAAKNDDDDEDDAPVAKKAKTKKPAKTPAPVKTPAKTEKKAEAEPAKDAPAKPEPASPADKPGVRACPENIEVKPQDLAKNIDGWHSFSESAASVPLESVMIYANDKKNLVKLDPSKGTESFTEWHLPENIKGKYFIVCGYAHTPLLLKHELDAHMTECRLSFESDAGKPNAPQKMHKLTCQ